MDIEMPRIHAVTVTKCMVEPVPSAKTTAVSAYVNGGHVGSMLAAGVSGELGRTRIHCDRLPAIRAMDPEWPFTSPGIDGAALRDHR